MKKLKRMKKLKEVEVVVRSCWSCWKKLKKKERKKEEVKRRSWKQLFLLSFFSFLFPFSPLTLMNLPLLSTESLLPANRRASFLLIFFFIFPFSFLFGAIEKIEPRKIKKKKVFPCQNFFLSKRVKYDSGLIFPFLGLIGLQAVVSFSDRLPKKRRDKRELLIFRKRWS